MRLQSLESLKLKEIKNGAGRSVDKQPAVQLKPSAMLSSSLCAYRLRSVPVGETG